MSPPKFPGGKKRFEQVIIGDPTNSASTPELIVNGTTLLNGTVITDNFGLSTGGDLHTDGGLSVGFGAEIALDSDGVVFNIADGVYVAPAADLPVAGTGTILAATDTGDITTEGTVTSEQLVIDADGSNATAVDIGGGNVTIDGTTGDIVTIGTITAVAAGDASTLVGQVTLGDGHTAAANAILSGNTGYTSPYGAISIVQKTGVVQASTATAVLGATALAAAAQDIVAGITDPDVPRNVTATGNAAGIVGDVVVTGTNWAGETVTDTIALNGANEVAGVKAFTTVTAVHLPPEVHAGTDTVSIGCGNCLGLQRPIAAAGSVVEVARKAAAAAEYTIEATGTVSAANGTVDQSGVGAIVNDDRFEITYNASRL